MILGCANQFPIRQLITWSEGVLKVTASNCIKPTHAKEVQAAFKMSYILYSLKHAKMNEEV